MQGRVSHAGIYKLSSDPGSLGLSCDGDGLALAGIPLLQRAESGFLPRPEREVEALVGRAYDPDIPASRLMGGLGVVARALNAGDMAKAMIAAVQLRLPELDSDGAARIARAEDALAKYDPNQPRDWHGRWERTGGGAADAPLRLPPGKRIDELGDLLEWIANSRPDEAPAIRREIKRVYYDVGDTTGGNALNSALSDVLDSGGDRKTREDILDRFEPYTHADPAEIAQDRRSLAAFGLLAPLSEIPTPAAASDVWKLGWAARGRQINSAFGGKLSDTFPVIDKFVDGVATSIKSIDLNAGTYHDAARLSARIGTYIDQVAEFKGMTWGEDEVLPGSVTQRVLHLVIPRGSGTGVQLEAIQATIMRAHNQGVDVIVSPF